MSGNPLFSGQDNRNQQSDFYNYQFQKDLYNKNAPKIVGYKNNIDFDHPHKITLGDLLNTHIIQFQIKIIYYIMVCNL